MGKKKKVMLIVAGTLAVIAGGMWILMMQLERNMNQLEKLPVANIEMSEVSDGAYEGSYKMFPVDVEVLVTVEDHVITDIDLVKHTNGQGAPAEILTEVVIQAQSLDVDMVAGATYSSKVILKALEDALLKGFE
jgi:uncharacterized protein with FMN-binding domain